MKNSKEHAKVLASHLRKLKKKTDPVEMTDPIEVMVFSQLMWETTTSRATDMWSRLQDEIEDWHDLRVSMPDEIAMMAGDKSALATERASRLRSVLNTIYLRHHDVTLAPELEMGKRDVRESIESIEGMSPYVSARWLMLCVDVLGVPVDDQLRWMLVDAGCIDAGASVQEAASWVSRQIKSDQSHAAHAKLQAWVDGKSESVAAKRDKEAKAAARGAKTVRTASVKARAAAREEAAKKKIEAARRAEAKKAAAELAAAEKAAAAAERAAKKTAAKKTSVSKKVAKKKAAKKKVTKKKAAKKKVAKKKVTKKKAAKKKAARKTGTRKARGR